VILLLLTFHMVCLGWVFFRAQSITHAAELVGIMFGFLDGTGVSIQSRWYFYLALVSAWLLVAVHWFLRDRRLEEVSRKAGWAVTAVVAGIMLFLVLSHGGQSAEFIYFQF
jgi:hypothetical protein